MNINFYIQRNNLREFNNSVQAVIRNVSNGTKKGTTQACKEIMDDSYAQCPVDTGTLRSSGWWKVQRRADTKTYLYEGLLGYATMVSFNAAGIPVAMSGNQNNLNPKTGQLASSYALKVHEDLSAFHPVGKAKYLEDPVRAYGAANYTRVAEYFWKLSINESNKMYKSRVR